ncbi:MAG TPA: hypothetical protein VLD63_03630 [Anaerolineales bacterium]|nr:hypothetical protein [Anaerolineales bacterium]
MPFHTRSHTPSAVLLAGALTLLTGCAAPGPTSAGTPMSLPASPTSAAAVTSPVSPTRPAETIEASPTSAPCFTREELAALDLETIAAWEVICYRSDSGVETSIDQKAAVAAVRSLVGEAPQVIAFQEITIAPNSPTGDLKVLRLMDERGFEYLVAPLAEKVVEMDPPASWRASSGHTRSREELQLLAETLIAGQFPAFDQWKPTLNFEVGSKSEGMYFFRWEQPGPVQHMPVLAQVGITETGEVFSYINTLFYLPASPPYPTLRPG